MRYYHMAAFTKEIICKIIKSQVSAWQLHNNRRMLVFWLIKVTPVRIFFHSVQLNMVARLTLHNDFDITRFTLQGGLFQRNCSAIYLSFLSNFFYCLLIIVVWLLRKKIRLFCTIGALHLIFVFFPSWVNSGQICIIFAWLHFLQFLYWDFEIQFPRLQKCVWMWWFILVIEKNGLTISLCLYYKRASYYCY